MYHFILLTFNAAMDFNGFWSRVTLLDITLLVIIAFLIVFLIIVAINKKSIVI